MTADVITRLLQIVQIVFYVTAAVIAVLTYRSAKRGLLNTVRTEYQKRVMDRLSAIATDLWSEFDPASPNYWVKYRYDEPLTSSVNNRYAQHPESFKDAAKSFGQYAMLPPCRRLELMLSEIETDLFVPEQIRSRITEYLSRRIETLRGVSVQITDEYYAYLIKKQPTPEELKKDSGGGVHNLVNNALYARGFGVSQVEGDIAALRRSIQGYFESFNPGI